jgi:hypothetical protein
MMAKIQTETEAIWTEMKAIQARMKAMRDKRMAPNMEDDREETTAYQMQLRPV